MNSTAIQSRIDRLQHESYAARKRLRDEREAYREAKQHLQDAEQARSIAQQVAQAVQQQAHAKIAGVVTTCLKSVFGEDSYEFKIKFIRKRNRTEAQLILVKDGEEITDPINEDSGGVLDIASFGLRLACLILHKPQLRKILVLDEPFRFVSKSYRGNVRQMLLKLAEDFHLQIIMVTHIEELMCGTIIRL
jgi:DNA repair exonuclease SbcCD ATPase subunit